MNLDMSNFDNLSENEKEYALKILKELQEGNRDSLNKLKYSDFNEIPVDIETFITDDRYLGNAWKDAEGNTKLYPFWLDIIKDIFPNNLDTNYDTLLESGARGIGKSEIACGVVGAYLMYRVMCLKNPLEYYHLKLTEKVVFAFMNITKESAKKIAIDKFQKTVQMSPWFMSKGTMTSFEGSPYWVPPEPIEIVIGSQSSDVVGKPIFYCMEGNTLIKTSKGIEKLSDLVDKDIQVISLDENGNEVISEHCSVKPTLKTKEEYQIELEDGFIIKCTATHRFMLKDGSYKMAKDLTEEDELMSLDSSNKPFGYIYKFTNLKTNKIYIGKREKSSFDESYYGSGKLWKTDLQTYGKENIKREILCFGYSRSELCELEKYYIKLYNSQDDTIGYNIHKGGQGGNSLNNTELWSKLHLGERNGRYGKEVSKETRNKISKSNKGKIRTQEFKDRISRLNKGKKKPEGFGDKISKAEKGRRPIWAEKKVLCEETNLIYDSVVIASRQTNIIKQNISRACRHHNYTAGGYHWRYVDEN